MKSVQNRSSCPIGKTLDVLGDRWSLLIMRGMIFGGSTTFKELSEYPEHIATNILSERLERLESEGIIVKLPDFNDGRKNIYRVSEKGLDLMPLLLEYIKWGMKYNKDASYPQHLVDAVVKNKRVLLEQARLVQTYAE